ncbi:unnamed protein product [Hapterophycus canaliculatus]
MTSASTKYLLHTNAVPLTPDGRVLHLELRSGEVANNIVTVGSDGRCKILASLLDSTSGTNGGNKDDDNSGSSSTPVERTITRRSKRGFVTHTGTYNGVPVSVVLINMGYPNMDFFVREVRAVTDGPLRIVRLGSCAGLRSDLPVGTVAVATEGSILIRQNPDAWEVAGGGATKGDGSSAAVQHEEKEVRHNEPYLFHGVVPADKELSNALLHELERSMDRGDGTAGGSNVSGNAVVGCLNASADSFYSSQGRLDPSFEDRNDDLVPSLLARHPSVGTFEMETFQLLHLARLCRKGTLVASAASIVLANRIADDAIAVERISEIERSAGLAALRAVTSFGP